MSFTRYHDFYRSIEHLTTLSEDDLTFDVYQHACQDVIDHLEDGWAYRALEELHDNQLAHECVKKIPDLFAVLMRSIFVGQPTWTTLQDAFYDIFSEYHAFIRQLGWTHHEWLDGKGAHAHRRCTLRLTPNDALFLSQWSGFEHIWDHPTVKRPPLPMTAPDFITYYQEDWPYLLPFEHDIFTLFTPEEQQHIVDAIVPRMMDHPAFTLKANPPSLVFGAGYHVLLEQWCHRTTTETCPLLVSFMMNARYHLPQLPAYHGLYQYLPLPMLLHLYTSGYLPTTTTVDLSVIEDFHCYQRGHAYEHAWPSMTALMNVDTTPYHTVVATWMMSPTILSEISLEL